MNALTDEEIADLWDFDLSARWVRIKLAERIRAAGYIVVPASTTGSEQPLDRDGHTCPCPHQAGHPACVCSSDGPTGSEQP